MADNRMFLRCKVCGEAFMLAKNLANWLAGEAVGAGATNRGLIFFRYKRGKF